MTKPRLLVVGPVPPPVHGVTVSTTLVLANPILHELFAVEHLDTSDHRDRRNVGRWDATNVALGVAGLARLASTLRGVRGTVYLPLSQAVGAFLRDSLYIRTAHRMGWRVAIHLRGSEIRHLYDSQGGLFRGFARGTLGRVTSAAVMGESLRDVFGELVPSDRVEVVPNGTPRNSANGVTRDRYQVLFLSSLRRRKGVVEAVEAAAITARRVPRARFIFAGSWEDPELDEQVRARAEPSDGRIEFRGEVLGRAKDSLLASTGVLLFPPRDPEGHPRVVLEAIAAGLPVVATDRGAIRETIEEGVNGFVLSEPRPEELADRLIRLLEDDQLYESMSRAAYALYEERFTQQAADRRLAEWLLDVATAKSPP
jgi:glycosyltransferase involved in cell wall biosynthesis